MRTIFAAALLLGMAQPAPCSTITDYLKLHDEPLGREQTETELVGIQTGFMEANKFLAGMRREAPMYCQPETLHLTADQLVDMLRRGLKEQPEIDDDDLPSALLFVMQRTFPCEQSSK